MSTTNLFVELIVIGVGAFTWVGVLLSWMLGLRIEMFHGFDWKTWEAIPALALVYLLGIVADRVADKMFQFIWGDRKFAKSYTGGRGGYFKDRGYVLTHSDRFAEQYEYSRSRQRICRGWALNAVLLIIGFNLYASGNAALSSIRLPVSLILAAVAVLCWWSWAMMVNTELERIKEQAEILRGQTKTLAAKAST